MGQHKLSLDIPDILNDCIIRVVDTSAYDPDLPVTCATLNITVPGFSTSTEITTLSQAFSVNLTACDLGIQTEDCGETFSSLPDGIYVVKWSVAPNNYVYVEYNHLRITQTLLRYQKVLCSLDIAGCEPTAKTKEKLRELQYIKTLLYAAKAQVELCHHPDKGMQIFTYAIKLLSKFNCSTCR
jgi:hypothetical protein